MSTWIPSDFADLADATAHYLRPVRPDTWRTTMYLVSPYTWYAREDSRGLNVIPIRDGHTPPPDAVQLPTDLSDMALTHYNLSGATNRYYQQADGRPLFRWLCQLERAIRDTLAGTFPTDTPTAEEVARRADVAATVAAERAAAEAAEAERIRRATVMYVFVEPETHQLYLVGTWNDLHAAGHYGAPPDTSCYLTAPDLPANITNDQLLRYNELDRKIEEARSFTDSIRQSHSAHGFGTDFITFHDPVLMALIKERDALRDHFTDTLSAHHRRRHALLAWGVSHCGWTEVA
jgi:hypothetical protein